VLEVISSRLVFAYDIYTSSSGTMSCLFQPLISSWCMMDADCDAVSNSLSQAIR
jgi:hypothetical protein